MARSKRPTTDPSETVQSESGPLVQQRHEEEAVGADLNYNQARTALDLILNQLQASDLDIEAMAGLYQRGQAYAKRCEAILEQVEHDVLLWDGLNEPESPPKTLEATKMEHNHSDSTPQAGA